MANPMPPRSQEKTCNAGRPGEKHLYTDRQQYGGDATAQSPHMPRQ